MYIDVKTLSVIRKHARSLAEHSKNMQTWTASAYDRVLRFVNIETLSAVREYWLKYCNYADPDRSQFFRFRSQCKLIYDSTPSGFTTQALQALARSFGPRLLNAMNITEYHTNHFWKAGSVDKPSRPQDLQCNPMVMYSSSGGDRFAVHYRTNPLIGFHLAASLTALECDSPFFSSHSNLRERVLVCAKLQFKAWCTTFQKLAQKSIESKSKTGRVRIRFYVGDAVNFCRALNQLRTNHTDESNFYSRPWSAQRLRLDGPGFPNGYDRPPLSFNVIDTSNLGDDVGFLNILTATIPLLEHSASSTLYTETMRSYPSQGGTTNLLSDLLCGDVGTMCAILGIVPAPYVTGVSAHATDEAYVDDTTPVLNRINWKLATSTEAKLNPVEAKVACDPISLATLLCDVYVEMFAHRSVKYSERMRQVSPSKAIIRALQPHYSQSSFAELLGFLKSRICTINIWDVFIATLNKNIEKDPRLVVKRNGGVDLLLQLHLFGVYKNDEKPETSAPCLTYRFERGILKNENPPKVTGLILTVPRRKLRVVYKTCVDSRHQANMLFQINIIADSFINTFSSIQPIFGQLTGGRDDHTCVIERDPKGWFGTSDLHLCIYVPTLVLRAHDPKQVDVSVELQQEISTYTLFKQSLGQDLEIFRARLLSTEYVHLVESLPGLSPPSPLFVDPVTEPFATSNETSDITFPFLNPVDRTFTTRITVKGTAELEVLKSGQKIIFHRLEDCTLSVECGDFKYTCRYPFPLASESPRIRIARKSGWIEVVASLLSPQIAGASPKDCIPLIRDKRYGLTMWNAPYINFRQLPRISASEFTDMVDTWLPCHLFGMYSAYETPLLGPEKHGVFLEFKKSLLSVFEYIARTGGAESSVFTLAPMDLMMESGGPLLFFSTGLYLDGNSNTVVAETYVVPMTASQTLDPRFYPVMKKLAPAMTTTVDQDVFLLWKKLLPAMAERCRDWEHTASCEFADGLPEYFDPEKSPLCSCGVGKVGKNFSQGRWKEATSFVTRVAISPLFAAPYLETAKGGPLSRNPRIVESGATGTVRQRSVNHWTQERTTPAPATKAAMTLNENSNGNATTHSNMSTNTTADACVYKCSDCGKDGAKKCGACGEAYYCSRQCQRRDWKKHKAACQKVQSEWTAAAAAAAS